MSPVGFGIGDEEGKLEEVGCTLNIVLFVLRCREVLRGIVSQAI